jgi:hypothetical protein
MLSAIHSDPQAHQCHSDVSLGDYRHTQGVVTEIILWCKAIDHATSDTDMNIVSSQRVSSPMEELRSPEVLSLDRFFGGLARSNSTTKLMLRQQIQRSEEQ